MSDCVPSVSGLTVSESEDPEALDRHLQHLQVQRAALLDRKSHCVSLEVKAQLDAKLQTAESHRDQLSTKSHRCLNISDGQNLFDLAQYEKAALLAATSPGGVLRNLHTMTMFEAVQAPPGSVPPPLLFFQALLMTVPDGVELSASLSVVGVVLALQRGASQLVVHAVTQNKISFTEHLGDILTEHAQNNPGVADLCLALATIIYEACGLDRKTALSMCKRGLICSAAEFMKHHNKLTAEDCLWVLCRSPSLSLLQLLTKHRGRGRAAILSVTSVDLVLSGVLQDVILEDSDSSVEVWILIASLCSELKRADLSQDILSVLLDQGGTRVLSPDLEGAGLMEHVFL
uniref:Uncharacterized protein n=1 Tax=Seriola lalandi dorsalis TaxID=1841481 RepID=A0A3B4YPF8_SERLL